MASVTFINSEITVSEDVEVEVSCLIFTTATSAPLGQDVVVIVESADETAVSFSIGDGIIPAYMIPTLISHSLPLT